MKGQQSEAQAREILNGVERILFEHQIQSFDRPSGEVLLAALCTPTGTCTLSLPANSHGPVELWLHGAPLGERQLSLFDDRKRPLDVLTAALRLYTAGDGFYEELGTWQDLLLTDSGLNTHVIKAYLTHIQGRHTIMASRACGAVEKFLAARDDRLSAEQNGILACCLFSGRSGIVLPEKFGSIHINGLASNPVFTLLKGTEDEGAEMQRLVLEALASLQSKT
jgi:hypothetical protein